MALAIVAAGCSTDPQNDPVGTGEDGIITVRLAGDVMDARSGLFGSALNTVGLLEAAEYDVHNYTAYVFNSTGGLVGQASSDDPDTPLPVTVPAGIPLRVVVIANTEGATVPNFETGSSDELATTYLSLTEQQTNNTTTLLANGLVMTGEADDPVTLTAGGTETVTVNISRVVAKVQLGKITIDTDVEPSDLGKLSITGVSIQRALSKTTVGPLNADIEPEAVPTYLGGLVGSVSNTTSGDLGDTGTAALGDMGTGLFGALNAAIGAVFDVVGHLSPLDYLTQLLLPGFITGLLTDVSDAVTGVLGTVEGVVFSFTQALGLEFTLDNYFYVLPNNPDMYSDSGDFVPTLLTVSLLYDGTPYYIPIEVNPTSNTGDTGYGNYIQRNTIYTINLTITSPIGRTDPDDPTLPGGILVDIVPQDWLGPINQNVVW